MEWWCVVTNLPSFFHSSIGVKWCVVLHNTTHHHLASCLFIWWVHSSARRYSCCGELVLFDYGCSTKSCAFVTRSIVSQKIEGCSSVFYPSAFFFAACCHGAVYIWYGTGWPSERETERCVYVCALYLFVYLFACLESGEKDKHVFFFP